MSIPGSGSPLLLATTAAAAVDAGYVIPKSLRFNSGDNAHLTRKPTSDGNKRTWTFSAWVKRAVGSSKSTIFGAEYSNFSRYFLARFETDDTLDIFGGVYSTSNTTTREYLRTTQVFRDYSAWYHIVMAQDSTQSTASDRMKVYVNGQQVTDFSTETYPAQNSEGFVNAAIADHYIGQWGNNNDYFDGQIADIQFVDGQQLLPTDFGETRSSDGVWVPKEYTGPYGPNKVSEATGALPILNTTGDFGGTAASGTRTDANSSNIVLALPFNGSDGGTTIADQHATIKGSGSAKTISRAGVVTKTAESQFYGSSAFFDGTDDTIEITSGLSDLAFGTGDFTVEGWAYRTGNTQYAPMLEVGNHINSTGIFFMFADSNASNAARFYSGGFYGNTGTLPLNEWYHLAFVRNGNTVKIYVNGVERSSVAFTNNLTDSSSAYISDTVGYSYRFQGYMNDLRVYKGVAKYTSNFVPPLRSGNGFHLNFSDSSTNEALGFDSAPTIPDLDPKKGMDVITYTGNGTTGRSIGGLNFEPDLVWIKRRSAAYGHVFSDSVRGFGSTLWAKQLIGNSNEVENTGAVSTIRSFDPGGFTLGTDGGVNLNGSTYVAWCWRAGGPAVANTDGTTTSQISANTDYGFSIVSFTGTGSTATIGHGLGATPKWIIVKKRNSTANWVCYHDSLGANNHVKLSTNAAANTAANIYTSVPTSSVFTLGSETDVNGNNDTFIAYCWSEVSGYSKFGSYTGTSSTVTVTTGFKPRWVLVRNTTTGSLDWVVVDSERSNADAKLFPNTTAAESAQDAFDFNDDGFTIKVVDHPMNKDGDTFIFIAFADRPGNNWDVNNIVTNEGLTTNKDNFDVVTFTGNGGTNIIGGPVYSDTTDSGFANKQYIFNGDENQAGYYNGTGTDNTITTAPITINTQLRVYNNFRSDGTYAICLNGTCVTVPGSGTNSGNYRWSTVDLSGFTLPLTVTSLGYSNSQNSGNSIAKIEVDGTVLLDGDGGPGLKFQPDLVWVKTRSNAQNAGLFDSVRGAGRSLRSATNGAEQGPNTGTDGDLRSFNSNGFTLGDCSVSGAAAINVNNQTQVAWCWKAGGTAVSNTDGSVTSSVSVNASHGFSIVTYSATGSDLTVGHGLGKKPALIILKSRNVSGDWLVMHKHAEPNKFLKLNETQAEANASNVFTSVTDSVFGTGNDSGINSSGQNKVAYCFANIPGYQKIGSYYSNSSDPIVITGFKPRFLLVKKYDGTGHWMLLDSERSRDDDDVRTTFEINNSNAEETHANRQVKFLDNGFQLIGADMDTSNDYWFYWAIGDDEIGSDEDCLVDVPNAVTADEDATDTTGGYQRGNYATLNPLVASHTYSNGNLDFTFSTTGNTSIPPIQSTIAMPSGKWYAEMTMGSGATGMTVGLWNSENFTNDHPGSTADSYAYWSGNGNKYNNDSNSSYGDSFTEGDVIGIAFDADGGTLEFYKNGVSQGTAYTGITSRNYVFAGHKGTPGTDVRSGKWNFGQMRFKYPMPTGFSSLNTTALPAATIEDGSAYFDTLLWTGDGASSTREITGLSMANAPDWIWAKERNGGSSYALFDAVRGFGTNNVLKSNSTDTSGGSNGGYISATSTSSITWAQGTSTAEFYDANNKTYVAWCWDAGSSTVTNTDGTGTCQLRANPSVGFSIATFTGVGTAKSYGHGLNAAPEMVIVKGINHSDGWSVYHSALGNTKSVALNQTSAAYTSSVWDNTTPSNTVTRVGGDYRNTGNTNLILSFTSVAGYSAFGEYIGNSSTDGPFIYTGFKVAWLMIKNVTDNGWSWNIYDTSRDSTNANNKLLRPDYAANEISAYAIDFLSNGFKLKWSDGAINQTGKDYIYAAFAEKPFQANGGLAR